MQGKTEEGDMMKHIVLFSGGAASSYTAYLVAQKEKDVILLHTPTYAEHPDADRFRKEVAAYIGIPITEYADGRDLWQVIRDNKCLPDAKNFPFCTRILKLETRLKYLKELNDDYTLYYGYDIKEYHRAQNVFTKAEMNGEKVAFPLIEAQLRSDEVKRRIVNDWGICLPEPYKHLQHNNCIPCFKGGKGHFRTVAKWYPDQFKKALQMEKEIGYTVFKDCSLEDIWRQTEADRNTDNFLDDLESQVPCVCSI